jgi:hypothetical protein
MGLFDKKTEVRKSRDTVPLNIHITLAQIGTYKKKNHMNQETM